MKPILYLTDTNPNGTNDLLVYSPILDTTYCIEEATFGYMLNPKRETYFVNRDGIIDNEGDVAIQEVSLSQIQFHLACSPIDPNGNRTLKRILNTILDAKAVA